MMGASLMERGFYHAVLGYWQAIGDVLADILSYPAGTVEVPLKPGADVQWKDGVWVHVLRLS